jgi:hypothetical protein
MHQSHNRVVLIRSRITADSVPRRQLESGGERFNMKDKATVPLIVASVSRGDIFPTRVLEEESRF